jgi:hypothetical protein
MIDLVGYLSRKLSYIDNVELIFRADNLAQVVWKPSALGTEYRSIKDDILVILHGDKCSVTLLHVTILLIQHLGHERASKLACSGTRAGQLELSFQAVIYRCFRNRKAIERVIR